MGMKGTPAAKSLALVFAAFNRAADRGAEKRRLSAMTQVIPRQQVVIDGKAVSTEVLSLSPSAADEETYVDILRKALPKTDRQLDEVPDDRHNLIASAILISVGDVVVLLGSDVEKGRNQSSGWRGIVSSADSPDLCLDVLKVPHHGSPTAHYRRAWEEHCQDGKIVSIVAPYDRGAQRRPSEDDIARIAENSKLIGLTSQISYKRPVEIYDRAIARRLPRVWRVIRPPQECGSIIVRYDLDGAKTMEKAVAPAVWIQPKLRVA